MSTFVSEVINTDASFGYRRYIENGERNSKLPIFDFKLKVTVTNNNATATTFAVALFTYQRNYFFDYSINLKTNGEPIVISTDPQNTKINKIVYYQNRNLLPGQSVDIDVDILSLNIYEINDTFPQAGFYINFKPDPSPVQIFGYFSYTRGPRETNPYD